MIKTVTLILAVVAMQVVSLDAASAQRASRSSAERDRANSRDPAGTFRGYPAWAASALSPRGTGK